MGAGQQEGKGGEIVGSGRDEGRGEGKRRLVIVEREEERRSGEEFGTLTLASASSSAAHAALRC